MAIPTAVFLYNDYSLFGTSSLFYVLTALRLGLLAFALLLIFYLNKIKNHQLYEKTITAWLILAVLSVSFVALTRPAIFIPFQTILIAVYVLVIWIVIPNLFRNQLILSLILTLSQIAAILTNAGSMSLSMLLTTILSLVLAYGIGFSSSWLMKGCRMETVKEIATRERAEDALRHSEQLYRTIFENSDDGFMLVEPVYNEIGDARDIRFLKLNSAYEHQTGAKEADVLGKKASDVVPELEPTVISLSVEVAKNGKSTHAENYDKYSNKWYDTQFIPFSEGQVGILFRDITERKTAEETLKEAEEKFKNMIEQSPDVFGLYDFKHFFLIQVNLAWDKLWEVPRELAIGKWNPLQSKQVSDIGWIPLIKRAYAGETVDVPEIEFDPSLEPLTMGKGRKRWIKSIIYPIKNIQGEVQNIVMMHQDITDRKLLEKQLEDKERLAVIGQTAGMVGHDIRNPLQAVLSDTYILKDELSAMPEVQNQGRRS